MYYAQDRTYSAVLLIFSLLVLGISISGTYVTLQSAPREPCVILDILNLTDNKVTDIVFLVNRTSENKEDIAYGSSYYILGEQYTCRSIMETVIIDSGFNYFDASQILSIILSVIAVIVFIGMCIFTTKVYYDSKDYIRFK